MKLFRLALIALALTASTACGSLTTGPEDPQEGGVMGSGGG